MSENDANTVISDETGHWSETIVGDNAERAEAMKAYEDPNAFFEAHDALANKDFRKEMATDADGTVDDKFLASLQRYGNTAEVGKAFREQRATISSGNLKAEPGPDATDEDIQAYREANGIPLEAKGYLENLPEGLVVGEADAEIFDDYLTAIHGENASPAIAHKTLEWYNNFAQKQQDAIADMDSDHTEESNKILREEWGGDFRANMNLINGLIASTFGQDSADQMLNGRYADGKAFMNDPEVLKGLATLARQINPVMEMGGDNHTAQESLNDEIKEIEKYMAENRTEYMKDEAKQARLRDLYDLRLKQAAA